MATSLRNPDDFFYVIEPAQVLVALTDVLVQQNPSSNFVKPSHLMRDANSNQALRHFKTFKSHTVLETCNRGMSWLN